MARGICTAYDGPAGPGMGDVCLYDSCDSAHCTRLAIAQGGPDEPENPDARRLRDELGQRGGAMGLDSRDLPEGVEDFPDAAYQKWPTPPPSATMGSSLNLDVSDIVVAPDERPDRLPNSKTRIPDNRTDMIDLLEQCEMQLEAMDAEVQRLSGELDKAREARDKAYNTRQARRQDVRVLRERIRATMPLEFPT